MTEIPEHLLKRAEAARQKAASQPLDKQEEPLVFGIKKEPQPRLFLRMIHTESTTALAKISSGV
ncbi:hypothetical protein KC960_05040 [Candidatus Saccharibacteria bacterium]|nr:hypothetical protein [Candidatus Saccharibacteria bacterium]